MKFITSDDIFSIIAGIVVIFYVYYLLFIKLNDEDDGPHMS